MNHWKTLLVVIVAIMLIIVVASSGLFNQLSNAISGNNSNSTAANSTGDTRVATLDGKSLNVFETQEAAASNKTVVEAGKKALNVPNAEHVYISTYVNGNSANIVSSIDSNSYTLDLSNVPDNGTVVIKIETGGDGSALGKRLGISHINTQFVALSVSNPTLNTEPEATAALGIPNGRIYFGEDVYQTYASEGEAQQAVRGQRSQFTIPTYMVENGLQLRAEPNEATARIRVQVCMVGTKPVSVTGALLNNSSNWSGTLNVSNYVGQQVTLMIHAENGMGLSNGYSYVSFFVPEPIQENQGLEDEALG